MAKKLETLVSPDGSREWTPDDATQATNLRARGWTPKPAEEPAPDGDKAVTPKSTK